MNNVYVPVHVALFIRRVLNVISSLSVSNQYLLSRSDDLHRSLTADPGLGEVHSNRDHHTTKLSLKRVVTLAAEEWNRLALSLRWRWSSLERNPEAPGFFQRTLPRQSLTNLWVNPESHQPNTRSSLRLTSSCVSATPALPGQQPSAYEPLSSLQNQETPKVSSQPSSERKQHPQREPPPHPNPTPPFNTQNPEPLDQIHQLLWNPALYDPLRTPRYPIVLCHGLYGFDSRGPSTFPSMRMHYWSNVLSILRKKVGAEVIITSVPGTGSITSRSESLDRQLQAKAYGRGVNFLAHSMGGLDCRHLISHVKPADYAPLSLTTISTPHRGSPFMDWCVENIGIGKLGSKRESEIPQDRFADNLSTSLMPPPPTTTKPSPSFPLSLATLPSSFTTLLLSIVDSPAYANLTSSYLNEVFNPATPNDPRVKYFSVAARMPSVSVWHPFWLPKTVLDAAEEKERTRLTLMRDIQKSSNFSGDHGPALYLNALDNWGNDGLVTVQSAKWGEFLGVMEGCDHWEMRGARGIEFGVDLPAIPSIGLGGVQSRRRGDDNGDGWSFRDWGRFVGAWRKEERIQDAKTKREAPSTPLGRELKRKQEQEQDYAVLKSSTDKLSAVVDWLVDQIPASPQSKPEDSERKVGSELTERRGQKRNELATKLDLERFYVALSRKMYDEGL